jgi:phospholipid/cholesterol/gamma-HCH transport system substrate-binding protein
MSGMPRLRARAVSAPGIATLAIAICATSSCSQASEHRSAAEFCAIMSDSVGLYVGNPVTQMGYPIGTVDAIKARNADIEVKFSVTEDRPIPRDVKAVTRSPSILADRSLELVGNYDAGPRLLPGDCISRSQTSTPMSISRTIGAATKFVNGINPDGSTNIKDALRGVDKAAKGNGGGVNKLLTTASGLLDNPDQAVGDLGSVTRNVDKLTSMLVATRDPLKQIVQDATITTPYANNAIDGVMPLAIAIPQLVTAVDDIERTLGPDIQLTMDSLSDFLRHLAPHYKGIANVLNPIPRYISGLANEPPGATAGALAKHINDHIFHGFNLLPYRPPIYRIQSPNAPVLCGLMNASMPGSCAAVAGQPYAMDVALLQYVLTEAQRR